MLMRYQVLLLNVSSDLHHALTHRLQGMDVDFTLVSSHQNIVHLCTEHPFHLIVLHFPDTALCNEFLIALRRVSYAQSYVDIIYCGDSLYTPVEDYSVDIIVFRFLNSEVVSKEYAHKLFNVLIKKLADSGIAVLFGHTAVLLKSVDFENAGYEVLQSTGYCEERDSIFQFYMIKRSPVNKS